jgi:hypothetical protein
MVIQYIFDHFNFFVHDACRLVFLELVSQQKAIEVLVWSLATNWKVPGKVALVAQCLINLENCTYWISIWEIWVFVNALEASIYTGCRGYSGTTNYLNIKKHIFFYCNNSL